MYGEISIYQIRFRLSHLAANISSPKVRELHDHFLKRERALYIYIFQDEKCRLMRNLSLSKIKPYWLTWRCLMLKKVLNVIIKYIWKQRPEEKRCDRKKYNFEFEIFFWCGRKNGVVCLPPLIPSWGVSKGLGKFWEWLGNWEVSQMSVFLGNFSDCPNFCQNLMLLFKKDFKDFSNPWE